MGPSGLWGLVGLWGTTWIMGPSGLWGLVDYGALVHYGA